MCFRSRLICLLGVSFLIAVNVSNADGATVFDWIWGGSQETNDAIDHTGTVPKVSVPYEMQSDDEKFLQEAAKYTSIQLSELDSCQHRVVMKIRGSCSSMSEEDLAKMSVNLLNCQSSVEGRQVFPCTTSMALRDCTKDMDSDMWNTYHLMSNRARAVCYSTRHQQFRALSEMTVNKLMASAHDQLAAMAILKEGQHKLESMTSNTLETVAEGHKTLTQQQERLRSTQQNLQAFVSLNLHQLTREKALIAAGHSELAKMTADVKSKLDEASQQLTSQASDRRDNHQQLVQDLDTIQKQAELIWDRIEHSTSAILAQHASAAAQYEDTLVKLSRINDTVNFLLALVDQTRLELDIRLAWITSFMGGTGDKLERVYSCILHGLYLLLGMIAASFLQAPRLTRACLLLIVLLNLTVSYNHGPETALDFAAMTTIIITSTAVNWFLHLILAIIPGNSNHQQIQYKMNGVEPLPSMKQLTAWAKLKLMLEDLFVRFNWRLKTSTEAIRGQTNNTAPASRSDSVHSWVRSHSYRSSTKNPSPRPLRTCDSSDSDVDERPARLSSTDDEGVPPARVETPTLRKRTAASYLFDGPPTPSRTPSRSGTPASMSGLPRLMCSAVCRSGQPCKNSAVGGTDVCRRHITEAPYS